MLFCDLAITLVNLVLEPLFDFAVGAGLQNLADAVENVAEAIAGALGCTLS